MRPMQKPVSSRYITPFLPTTAVPSFLLAPLPPALFTGSKRDKALGKETRHVKPSRSMVSGFSILLSHRQALHFLISLAQLLQQL